MKGPLKWWTELLGVGRLGTKTFSCLDFYVLGLLGTRGRKIFFHFLKIFSKKKIFLICFSRNSIFSIKFFLFQITVFFQRTVFFNFLFFFQKLIFFQIKPFKTNVFQKKSFTAIKMLILWKLFIWHLSRIVRIEGAGKGTAIEKSRAVIGEKRINEKASFVYNL